MAKYGACAYEIEDLTLDAGGLPGLTFSGTLSIEPDDALANEDWYIANAWADGTTYRDGIIFSAIVTAVAEDKDLCDFIGEFSREHV